MIWNLQKLNKRIRLRSIGNNSKGSALEFGIIDYLRYEKGIAEVEMHLTEERDLLHVLAAGVNYELEVDYFHNQRERKGSQDRARDYFFITSIKEG